MGLNSDISTAEMWPIQAKGSVQRLNPLGDPTIEQYYHTAMEQGRVLERNIGDAQHWLLQKKALLMQHIDNYTNMNALAIHGKLSDVPRAILYAKDSINILKAVATLQQEIIGLISAVTQNIGILQMIEANMVGMIQQSLNAMSLLLNEVCNWGLPKLPSIPNLFSDTIWHWNGMNFAPLSAFKLTAASLKFSTSFAFSQCSISTPNLNVFSNYPSSITTPSGLSYGTTAFVPPLSGSISSASSLTDPTVVSTLQATTTPVYLPANSAAYNLAQPFNVNSSMQGALPSPTTIISNYQLDPDTYQSDIVSIVPELTSLTVEPTDSDYSNPNMTVRNANLQKALAHYVTLAQVVASNYDPNLTAAWLFYMNITRTGRAGTWIQAFQEDFTSYITPSITYLANTSIPWNTVVPCTQTNNTPPAIPLIGTLTSATVATAGNILWRLSYLEASLLGYTRTTTWDTYATLEFSSSVTSTDLDYRATTLVPTITTTVILGEDTAEYPSTCTFPSAMGAVLQQVIATAALNILNTPSYVSSRPQNRYIYNQFAIATVIDKFSQFWRDFNSNLQALLLQDSYLVQFVVSYAGELDSAIDPLGDSTAYNYLKNDAATRNRSWLPGTPLLNTPIAPLVTVSNSDSASAGQTGYTMNSDGTLAFNPNTFLARPDIQQQPISVQMAMLRTSLNYASTQTMGQTLSNAIQASIAQSQSLIQDFSSVGFSVSTNIVSNVVPVGATGLIVSFDAVTFDLTNYITSPSSFTIQSANAYAIAVDLNWSAGDAGTRTVNLVLNGDIVIATATVDDAEATQVSISQNFNAGDVLTVVAIHGLLTEQSIIAGSSISATLLSTSSSNNVLPTQSLATATTAIAGTVIATALTAVTAPIDNVVSIIDPTVVTDTMPIVGGIALSSGDVGDSITIAANYGSVYEDDSADFIEGGFLYVVEGGALSQDYNDVSSNCQWVIVAGVALSSTQFVYQPQAPLRLYPS